MNEWQLVLNIRRLKYVVLMGNVQLINRLGINKMRQPKYPPSKYPPAEWKGSVWEWHKKQLRRSRDEIPDKEGPWMSLEQSQRQRGTPPWEK